MGEVLAMRPGGLTELPDTTATGAVLAGHDLAKGSQLVTITLSVQYLSAGFFRWQSAGRGGVGMAALSVEM